VCGDDGLDGGSGRDDLVFDNAMIVDTSYGTPQFQTPISFTGSGDQIVIPAMPGYRIAVLQFFFILSAASVLTYKSGATALTGPLSFLANGAQVQDFTRLPIQCVADGDPFVINSSTPVTLGGTIWWAGATSVH
jgi:hypothetical protein